MTKLDLKTRTNALQRTVREQTVGYVVAACSLIAGLAWNDAVKAVITYFFPADDAESIAAKFIYAAVMTIVVVVFTIVVKRMLEPKVDER